MKNKLFIATLASAVAVPAIVMPIQAEAVVKSPFKDVSKNSPYYEIIHEMRDKGIISGYENGTFRANESISRKHAAALVSRSKELPVVTQFVKFKDVSEKNAYFQDIKKLQQAGIFSPDTKGNLNPNQPITRAEMAKILTIAFNLKAKDNMNFPDVPKSHPATEYVRALYSNGITTGDNGYFKPDAALTRAHYAVFMFRAMNYSDAPLYLGSMTETELNALSNEQILNELVMFRYKHGEDVPLPKGQTDRSTFSKQRAKEFNTYFVQNGLDRTTSIPLISRYSMDNNIKNQANTINKSLADLIKMHNHAVTKGELITNGEDDPVKFAIYFNYEENRLYFAFRSY